jgi:hypothetical protein
MATLQYKFDNIPNGGFHEGYTRIIIVNHLAQVSAEDTEAIELAERYGGQRLEPVKAKKSKKGDN